MSEAPHVIPKPVQLFTATLVAAALFYAVGVVLIAIEVAATSPSGGVRDALVFLGFAATGGMFVSGLAGVAIVAPLGTAFGTLVLRLSQPVWWQGPVTGVLVAAVLIGGSVALLGWSGERVDAGTYAVAAVPFALAPLASAFVQRRMLHWPQPS